MVCNHLWHLLEDKNILAAEEFAFRRRRGLGDFHATLESQIHIAINRKQHVLSTFLDLGKAYDRVWCRHVLSELESYGIREQMLNFVHNFLKSRTFQVSIGGHSSSIFTQENGLPQGSVFVSGSSE